MNKLKTAISALVAIAICLSLITAAGAAGFPDVAAENPYAPAIELLSSLSIVAGDESGFRPGDNIKRSEFCKIAYVIYTGSPDASAYIKASLFTDVAQNAWYNGYVNWASENGIVGGMGDGTFAPDSSVTIEQVIKMLIVAIAGAPENPVWPTTYLEMAEKTYLCQGVSYTATNLPATREQVAQLGCNAIFEYSTLLSASPNSKFFKSENPMAKGPSEVLILTATYNKSVVDRELKLHFITAPQNIGLAVMVKPNLIDMLYSTKEYPYSGKNIDALAGQPVKVTFTDESRTAVARVDALPSFTAVANDLSWEKTEDTTRYYYKGQQISVDSELFSKERAFYVGTATGTYYTISSQKCFQNQSDDLVTLIDSNEDGTYDYIFFRYTLNGMQITAVNAENLSIDVTPPSVRSGNYIGAATLLVDSVEGLSAGDWIDLNYYYSAGREKRVHTVTLANVIEGAVLEAMDFDRCVFKLADGSSFAAYIGQQTYPNNITADNAAIEQLSASNTGKSFTVILDRTGYIVKAFIN